LKQTFVRVVGDAVLVEIESNTKALSDEDYDRISDKVFDLRSEILRRYPDKEFVEIKSYV